MAPREPRDDSPGAPMTRIVIVGNGMVSHRLCEKLVAHRQAGGGAHGQPGSITVCGEEPRPAYDRVHLTEYFAHRSADRLSLGSPAWYAEHGIELRLATRVAAIRCG